MSEIELLRLEVHTVDGGILDIPEDNPDEFMKKLSDLRTSGLEGKRLLNQLITDDWGVPPLLVLVKGKYKNGEEINFTLPYDS